MAANILQHGKYGMGLKRLKQKWRIIMKYHQKQKAMNVCLASGVRVL